MGKKERVLYRNEVNDLYARQNQNCITILPQYAETRGNITSCVIIFLAL